MAFVWRFWSCSLGLLEVDFAFGGGLEVAALDSWGWTWLSVSVLLLRPWSLGGGLGFRWRSCSCSFGFLEVVLAFGGRLAVAALDSWRWTWISVSVLWIGLSMFVLQLWPWTLGGGLGFWWRSCSGSLGLLEADLAFGVGSCSGSLVLLEVDLAFGGCLAVAALKSRRWTWFSVAVLQWRSCTSGGRLGFRWRSCSGSLEVLEMDLAFGGGIAVAVLNPLWLTWLQAVILLVGRAWSLCLWVGLGHCACGSVLPCADPIPTMTHLRHHSTACFLCSSAV